MPASTAYDAMIERGQVAQNIKLLLRQGRQRFGSADPAIEAEIMAIQDLDRLERLSDAILTATSWKELVATP